MLSSAAGSAVFGSSNSESAVYKGLAVTVYSLDMTDVTLTGQDFVDLVHVCTPLLIAMAESVSESCLLYTSDAADE